MKQVFITSIFLIIGQFSFAQFIPISMEQKVQSSDLIVEGKVISQETFKSEDGYIFTRNRIKPEKVLKGDIGETRELEIITRGGELDGVVETWSHFLTLEVGHYGVFFLKRDKKSGNSSFSVYSSGQGFLKFNERGRTLTASDCLKDYKNIHSEIYGRIAELGDTKMRIVAAADPMKDKPNCLKIVITPIIDPHAEFATSVDLGISAALTETPLYLKDAEIFVFYNPDQLGENVIANGAVEVSDGSELPDALYNTAAVDVGPNNFKITISSTTTQNDYLLLDGFLKEILRVKINFSGGLFIPDFFISDGQVMDDAFFVDPSTLVQTKVECVDINLPPETVACPIITGFTPDTVAAGVEDMYLNNIPGIITIKGMNFGNPSAAFIKPHFSDVRFYDVDSGWFSAAELEYISWNDTMIVVRVPTMRKSGGDYLSYGACTERIGVFTTDFVTGDTCTTYSAKKLYVRFGMFNDSWRNQVNNWEISQGVFVDTTIHGGKRRNLIERNGMGGYNLLIEDFYPDTTKNNAAKDQAIKALDVYRCTYKINVEVATTPPFHARIFKDSLPTGITSTTFMQGNSNSFNCNPTTNDDSPVATFNVIVNEVVLDTLMVVDSSTMDTLTFMFNLSDTIPSDTGSVFYIDFQKTMIHELGHAFQLRHTNNVGDMMASGKIDVPGFNNFNRSLSANDDLGVRHTHLLGKVGTCIHGPASDYVCTTNTIELSDEFNKVLIYPNPTQDIIQIEFSEPAINVSVEIVNLNGQAVHQYDGLGSGNNFAVGLPPGLNNGLYLLHIKGDESKTNFISKIIVQK